MSYFEHDYSEISKMAKISALKSFRIYQNLLLFYKVINKHSPILLSKINIRVLGRHLQYNVNTFDNTLRINDLNKISLLTDLA